MSTPPANTVSSTETSGKDRLRPATGIIVALFCGYLAVGLPLPVLPLFLHKGLGFSNLTVGLIIGVQFLATVLTRGHAGRITDQHGGKRAALKGAIFSALGGLLYLVAGLPFFSPEPALAVIILGRLAAGFGESLFVTGCVSWSIASVGPTRAGLSMSWTGIAMFAALSIGAPTGMALYQAQGFQAATGACIAMPLVAAIIAHVTTSYTAPAGQRLPFHRVVSQIWREGLGLMLQGVGLSALMAFASLYFTSRGWDHAGLVMTSFGIGFIVVRLALGHLPDRIGGYRVAIGSLIVEALGQLMMWSAPNETVALAGALVTGLGCGLVFPAFGVEALRRVLPSNRGSAMGAFVAFLDIAYGVSGPAAGWVAGHFGYASVYLLGASAALLGILVAISGSRSAPAN